MKNVIFCGRGPSSSLHLGHIICYEKIASYAKEKNLPILFQFSSDEKYFRDRNNKQFYLNQVNSDLTILSSIFKNNDVFFFDSLKDLSYDTIFKKNIPKIKINYFLPSFGLKGDNDPLEIVYPYVQAMIPSLLQEWGVTNIEIFSGRDQNPYFDLALKLNDTLNIKTTEIEFLPSIKMQEKMTSSNPEGCLFVDENLMTRTSKIRKALSGAESLELHLEKGLIRQKDDFCYEFLRLSGYDDNLMINYKKGIISSEKVKKELSSIIESHLEKLFEEGSLYNKKTREFNQKLVKEWLQI